VARRRRGRHFAGVEQSRHARVARTWALAVRPLALAHALACAPNDDGLPVVARGRYVEIATARDEPVCAGTAAYMDRVIDSVFAVMNESPPDHPYVRFEWLELDEEDPVIGGGRASFSGDGVLIRSDVHLVQEHELVHAVQMHAWPMPNDFLFEGHAVLLDPKRVAQDAYPWPATASLDELIGARDIPGGDYPLAWFIVSQIVLDHGFDGLREFWHAVPRGSTAAEVRAAYEELFGRSIDALIEPYVVEYSPPFGPQEIERRACDFALCPAPEVTPWQGDQWTALGPLGCEDDPDAIGPDRRPSDWGEVWRDYTLIGDPAFYGFEYGAGSSVSIAACALNCDYQSTGIGGAEGPPFSSVPAYRGWWDSPMRVEVRAALVDLPTETPAVATITRTFEPPQ